MSEQFRLLALGALAFAAAVSPALADLPCSPIATNHSGFVCRCNATYCDTITAPTKLQTGKFYHYITSNESLGFTRTTGKFSKEGDFGNSRSDNSSAVKVVVNTTVLYQTFKGLGAALTDTCGSLIQNLSSGTIDNLMESYFGEKGLEYPYLRISVASSDYSPSYYTYDDVDGDVDLKYWNLTIQDLNIKIPLILKARNISSRGLNILASPWTAPSWMKTSNSYLQGYLYNKYMEAYSMYLIKFLQAYKEEGVDIWAMTLGNEVILSLYFGPTFEMANMIMLPAQQRYWVKNYLGPMLQEAGFGDLKLYALDDERPFLTWNSERMFSDPEFSKYVAGVSLHWYFDWNTTLDQMDLFHKTYTGKSIIYAEASINSAQADFPDDATALGYWPDAERYILDIYEAMCHWSEMYLDWNLVLDTYGGPVGLDDFNLDASIIVNTTSGEFYKQPIYYALGHFSKFIQPGAQRVNVQIQQTSNDTYDEECNAASQEMRRVMAQYRGSRLSATKTGRKNLGDLPTKTPTVPTTAVRVLAALNPDGSQTVVVYNPRNENVKLTLKDTERGTLKRTLTPYSINTFVFW